MPVVSIGLSVVYLTIQRQQQGLLAQFFFYIAAYLKNRDEEILLDNKRRYN